jgi:DNA modification methylase
MKKQPKKLRNPAPAFRNRIVGLSYLKASELAEHPRNWRKHPSFQRKALDEVLARVGFAGALIVRVDPEGRHVVIDGHLRRQIAADEQVPCLVVDVDEQESELLLATWDPLSSLATSDPAVFAELVARQDESSEVLRQLFAKTTREAGPIPRDADREQIPAVPSSPRSRAGDLYRLGEHRLLCGDARSAKDVSRLMGKARARMLLTDPPWGVSYSGKTRRALRIVGDEQDGLEELLADAFSAIAPALSPGAALYVFHPSGPGQASFLAAFGAQGWVHRQTLTWLKDVLVLGHADYHHRAEPILYGHSPTKARFGRGASGWYGGHAESSVLEVPRPKASREHPISKPVELLRRLIANSSAPGDIVLDPFLGSGSSLIAAELLGRRCFAIEIDPAFVDVCVARWETYSGRKALRRRDRHE